MTARIYTRAAETIFGPHGNAGPIGPQKDTASDGWCTPKWLCDLLGEYDLDPCSNPRSHVRARRALRLEEGEDGLNVPWASLVPAGGRIFVNPPYSDVLPWAQHALVAAYAGRTVDLLLKLDPTTRWWATLMGSRTPIGLSPRGPFAVDVYPFKRRIKFERPDKSHLTANFPSVLVRLCGGTRWFLPTTMDEHVWSWKGGGQ